MPVMLFGLLLFSEAMLNVKSTPVFTEVSIGSHGPYRFLVDTAAQTSLIDPKLAAELGLKPEYRVEIASQNRVRLCPALKLNTLHIGDRPLRQSELVLDDLSEFRRRDPSIQGLLGLNALAGHDFTLLPRAGRLDLDPARPAGETIPFERLEDRIAVSARMGSETLTLILDSGANHVVLFRTPQAMAKTSSVSATMSTFEGARRTVATTWTADMFFGRGLRIGTQPAGIVARPGTSVDGLLPASVFKAVHVDQTRGEIVLVR